MRYSWLLFDADGTLFDFDRAEEKALKATFEQSGVAFRAEYGGLYHEINAAIWKEFEAGQISAEALRSERFARLFAAAGVTVDADEFGRRYLPNLALGSDLLPGAEATLRALAGKYHLAVITNGLKDVQRARLKTSGIDGLFEAVVISEEVGIAKPDVRYFEAAFALIGQPPKSDVLVIGDGLSSDIQGAWNAGVDACWFNPHGQPPDPRYPARYEIHALGELVGLLDSWREK